MADKFRKVAAGESLVLSASLQNAMIDTVRDHQTTKAGQSGSPPLTDTRSHANIVSAKYAGSSVTTLAAFSVLQISNAVLNPATHPYAASNRPLFEADSPTNASKPFVITTEPITGQRVGRVAVSGVAVVTVNVSNALHTRARPIVGTTSKLESCESGGVPIIWKASGTGDKAAQVLLDFADSSANGSSNCASNYSSIRAGGCASLSMPESPVGSCSCVPSQSASLTWEVAKSALTSATLLYGCPLGVFTSFCPSPVGAPRKWNVTLAGFTGSQCAPILGNWTLSYTSGNTWLQTRGGVTVTLTFTSATVATLVITWGGGYIVSYIATITGCGSTITFERDDDPICDDSPLTLVATPATSSGNGPAYTPKLYKCLDKCGRRTAVLEFVPVAGSGARSIIFDPPVCGVDANGNKYMDFATDDPLLCSGTVAGDCGDNKYVLRVTCGVCDDNFADPAAASCFCDPAQPRLCFSLSNPVGWSEEATAALTGVQSLLRFIECDYDAVSGNEAQAAAMAASSYLVCTAPSGIGGAPSHIWFGDFRYVCDGVESTGWVSLYPCCLDTLHTTFVVLVQFGESCGGAFAIIFTDSQEKAGNVTCSPFSVSGTFNVSGDTVDYTIASVEADADCPASGPSYNCIPGTGCVEVYDGSGASLADCTDACFGGGGGGGAVCPDLEGETPTFVIPNGPLAGTYTGTAWNLVTSGADSWMLSSITVPDANPTVTAQYYTAGPNAGVMLLGHTGVTTGSTVCGPPVVMTASGSVVASTGDVTVTT